MFVKKNVKQLQDTPDYDACLDAINKFHRLGGIPQSIAISGHLEPEQPRKNGTRRQVS